MSDDKSTILIIEDELSIRRFLRLTLVNQGYEVVEAATALAGLAQATTRPPDVVLRQVVAFASGMETTLATLS